MSALELVCDIRVTKNQTNSMALFSDHCHQTV